MSDVGAPAGVALAAGDLLKTLRFARSAMVLVGTSVGGAEAAADHFAKSAMHSCSP